MNMQTAVITCFKKSLMTGGRASRSEFWWFMLFNFIASVLLMIVIFPLAGLWVLVTVFPTMCVFIRRFQDMNISGWWLLLCPALMFSVIMAIIVARNAEILSWEVAELVSIIWFVGCPVLIFLINCIKGTAGDNRFGADPLAEENPH